MALYNNLREYRFNDTEVDDIRGAAVYGIDNEKLGKIDDVIYDDASGELRYVVIDSGGWLSTRRFIVPALRVMIREEGDKDFYVNMRKEQVDKLPEFKEKDVESDEQWKDYEKRYEAAYVEDGGVMHKKGSTHAITPDTVPGAGSGGQVRVQTPRRIAHDLPKFGAMSSRESVDPVSLAGETERQPVVSGTDGDRRSVGSMASEQVTESSEVKQSGDDLREDAIGTGRLEHNPRIRTFEEWMRKYKEDIAAKRKNDRAA